MSLLTALSASLPMLRAPPNTPSGSISQPLNLKFDNGAGGSVSCPSAPQPQLISMPNWTQSSSGTRATTPLHQHQGHLSVASMQGVPMQSHIYVPGFTRCDSAARVSLQGAVPKELAAKFEKNRGAAADAIAARKAAAAAPVAQGAMHSVPLGTDGGHPQLRQSSPRQVGSLRAPFATVSKCSDNKTPLQAHQRSPSRPRLELKPGSMILEDLDNKRLLGLQMQQGHTSLEFDHRSLSPRRSVARGPDRLAKRRSIDDTMLAQRTAISSCGNRQMFDKRTLRRRNKDEFSTAIQEWLAGHTAPGGRPRRAQGCHASVRMRPMFEKEQQQGEFEVVSVLEEWGEVVVHNCLFHADLVRMYVNHSGFCFPRAFGAAASNEDVYAECGWPLVSHALSGQLGTLFMFGQTGSGKTYTMSAIMELAARDIFAAIGDGDEVAVRLKAFEVAGQKCFDLLPRQRTQLKLLQDQSGRTNIIGAVEAPVPSANECLRLLREALARRATAVHARNDESSRSHCVVVLDLLAVGGSLILVDCAGTERRQDTDQHSAERMKESSEINSSLHVLKECIRYRCKQQHAEKQAATAGADEDQQHVHVPYRDSQLTRVLHESFTRSGSYLAAIGTIAPSSLDAEHSMSTLKTLQLLMSESGQSDAPNFEQRIDIDPKTLLKSSVLKRGFFSREHSRLSPSRAGASPPPRKEAPFPSTIVGAGAAGCSITVRPHGEAHGGEARVEAKEGELASASDTSVASMLPDTPSPSSWPEMVAEMSNGPAHPSSSSSAPAPAAEAVRPAGGGQSARTFAVDLSALPLLAGRTADSPRQLRHLRLSAGGEVYVPEEMSPVEGLVVESPRRPKQPRLQEGWCNEFPLPAEPQLPCPTQPPVPVLEAATRTSPVPPLVQPRVASERLQEARRRSPARAAGEARRRSPARADTSREVTDMTSKYGDLWNAAPNFQDPMQQENLRLQRQVQQLESSLVSARAAAVAPEPAARPEWMTAEISDARTRVEIAERHAEDAERRAELAERCIQEMEAKHLVLETLVRSEQENRKRSHNQLLDLKGQIRVFCRLRPLLPREQGEDTTAIRRDVFTVEVNKSMTTLEGMQRSERKAFPFDNVFGPAAQQEEVFREVEDLVQSAMDGYNVTILAYGQTGAGKTYTLYGGPGLHQGVAGRTIEAVFNTVERDKEKYDITVEASMIELYLANLRDLCSGEPIELRTIRQPDGTSSVRLEGATQIPVSHKEELSQVVAMGLQNRVTRATNMNEDSSRSHLLLTINVEVADRALSRTWAGKITIIDLAGSERIKKSGAVDDCQKEAIEINRALTALGDVIESLTRSPGRVPVSVPYRNHKLTQLLSDSIGGSAKTLMFVNVSPAKSEIEETLNSLTYASRARNIQNDVRGHQARHIRTASPSPALLLKRRIAGGAGSFSAPLHTAPPLPPAEEQQDARNL